MTNLWLWERSYNHDKVMITFHIVQDKTTEQIKILSIIHGIIKKWWKMSLIKINYSYHLDFNLSCKSDYDWLSDSITFNYYQ